MVFELLNPKNADRYIAYLKRAMSEEPDKMTAEFLDEDGIRERLRDPFYQQTKSILAMEDGLVIGRIEYHFYGCMQDGYRMAYVDWVYVLKEYRHRGVAQQLFRELERDCAENHIFQYYLIRATDKEADSFYKRFRDAESSYEPFLRKYLENH
ncbi:MAG: GNAT family N-acetyltransferase [Eubacterium sp.]|nr:GNAT family N-acetyltransferase [Eubacterium sp.]MCM1216454.1 GNAT family N-acetyltransferase [Lachnospiraceae bacterium]MCM1304311.1 GNAT family N-acetyltransferase [Butyrivibrio sp.]MCM1344058.1 GNAT family N-acetyltransferase [Muribaculaceae bacterium]MCM1240280.1 GNAT family N-acetyltransferase [Lachnospiraceae bacterium]